MTFNHRQSINSKRYDSHSRTTISKDIPGDLQAKLLTVNLENLEYEPVLINDLRTPPPPGEVRPLLRHTDVLVGEV